MPQQKKKKTLLRYERWLLLCRLCDSFTFCMLPGHVRFYLQYYRKGRIYIYAPPKRFFLAVALREALEEHREERKHLFWWKSGLLCNTRFNRKFGIWYLKAMPTHRWKMFNVQPEAHLLSLYCWRALAVLQHPSRCNVPLSLLRLFQAGEIKMIETE